MWRILTVTVFVALLMLATWGCDSGEQSIRLRFRYEPGMFLQSTQSFTRSTLMTHGDSIVYQDSSDVVAGIEQTCRRILPDSSAEILEVSRWTAVMNDTLNPQKRDTMEHTRELTMFVMPNGKITRIDYGPDMDSVSIAWMNAYYEQGSPVFPERSLRSGDSWTQFSRVVVGSDTMPSSTVFTVSAIQPCENERCAIINYAGNLVLPVGPSKTDSSKRGGVDRITMDGSMHMALSDGMILFQSEHWTVDGDRVRLKGADTVHLDITVRSKSEFRLLDRKRL